MGDLQIWSPELNGVVPNGKPSLLPLLSVSCISIENLREAEDATQRIITQVQPTVVSEARRKAVVDYVQRLIRKYLGCEVFPFGSVPLKTYLPDGDIDLTAIGGLNIEDALANDVCSVLEGEDQNRAAEFVVKDVQLIRAEVKLVKCLVQNIVVDISFNQLGGLSTLCFLEEVDRVIGKDHLFKRSIILIKAWCYYESRILGAHHGLISTYALETLVLYIFHLFHSSLDGPLAVLYKFLDYFSKFDWDKYCISLNGPVLISSLPEVVAEPLDNDGEDPLLSRDFLRSCVEKFSVSLWGFDTNSRAFLPKHLNIVDPLKDNNNLGRSVSKGNFYRIKSAFMYGARKLGGILSQPVENIAVELRKTFANTLDRHGSGRRPDVYDPVPPAGRNGFGIALSGSESYQEDSTTYGSESTGLSDHEKLLCDAFDNLKLPGADMNADISIKSQPLFINGTAVSESRLSEDDAKDLATFTEGLVILNDTPQSSKRANGDDSDVDKTCHAPHPYFSCSAHENGEMINGNSELNSAESPCNAVKNISSGVLPDHQDEIRVLTNGETLSPERSKSPTSLSSPNAWPENSCNGYSSYWPSAGTARDPEDLNYLPDLSGDNESHLRSLHLGRWCYEYALNAHAPPFSSPLLPQFHSKNSWDVVRSSVNLRRMNGNGIIPRGVFSMNMPIFPGAAFGMEEMSKPRGTGTYFPNTNTNHYRDRSMSVRGWNQGSMRSPRNNGHADTNWSERGGREMPQAPCYVHQSAGKSGSSDFHHFESADQKAYPYANGSTHQPEMVVETLQSPRATSHSGPALNGGNPSAPERQKSLSGTDQDRISLQSYHLKDEDDFPPLSNSM